MKALTKTINGRTMAILEPFDEWTKANMDWLLGKETETAEGGTIRTLPGDGWTLVEDYVAPEEPSYTETSGEKTYTIGGKVYTESELAKLVN